MALQSFVGPWPLFSVIIRYTVGRTFWTGDQPVARPLPAHRINAHTNIDTLSGIRTHEGRQFNALDLDRAVYGVMVTNSDNINNDASICIFVYESN
jgi:hypothetical protein